MIGIDTYESSVNTITGLDTIYVDEINGVPGQYFNGIRSNIQDQLDTIALKEGPTGFTGVTGVTGVTGQVLLE